MKPKHAMTFQAVAVGIALVLLALVGRSEAAYADGVYVVISGGLYVCYRITTRSPYRPVPSHRAELDRLVKRQTVGAGAAGLLSLLVVVAAALGPYHVTRILDVVLAAIVIGSLVIFLSSLVDWWWILPRLSGILRPAPCQCAGGESWPGVTSIWLFHRGLATVVVSGALTAIPAYMASSTTGHTATAYTIAAGVFGGTLAAFFNGAVIALFQCLSPKVRLGDRIAVDTRTAYVMDVEVSGVSYKLLDEDGRYADPPFQLKKSGSYSLSDLRHHPAVHSHTAPLCGEADCRDACCGVNWYCRWNEDAHK
ncbi:MAG TPA: hypothetical protein VK721_15370 [Solirubrobacteraceae bacterium]|jgi:hypothetical protein|nr:hypothetical protein [Solirubrobacteraceae bacterium]